MNDVSTKMEVISSETLESMKLKIRQLSEENAVLRIENESLRKALNGPSDEK